MGPDVTVLWKSECGKRDQILIRNHCVLLGDPAFVQIRPDASTAHCGGSVVQQGYCSVCCYVSTSFSVRKHPAPDKRII